jgi:hypothetical protein
VWRSRSREGKSRRWREVRMGYSGEDDAVTSPLRNTRSPYHLVHLTKHEHSKSSYL